MAEVVVVGGGIVGASAAYALARAGTRVTAIDAAYPGQATAAGAGIIAPGTSPHQPPAFLALMDHAVRAYPALLEALAGDGEVDTGYAVTGALIVAAGEAEVPALAGSARHALERRALGTPGIGAVSTIDPNEARLLFPALGELCGAVHLGGSARVDGRKLRDALRRAARRRGVTFVGGEARAVGAGGRVTGVEVDGRRLGCDAIVLAGGAWSGALAAVLDLRLPIAPQRGQILHLALPGVEIEGWPVVLTYRGHYLLTFPRDRVVAGATRERDAGFDARVTAGGVRQITDEALAIAPGLAGATVVGVRVGLRPASPDDLPVLGRVPGWENAVLATGHGASGLQLGPHSGEVAAALIQGQTPPLDLTPYSAERFLQRG